MKSIPQISTQGIIVCDIPYLGNKPAPRHYDLRPDQCDQAAALFPPPRTCNFNYRPGQNLCLGCKAPMDIVFDKQCTRNILPCTRCASFGTTYLTRSCKTAPFLSIQHFLTCYELSRTIGHKDTLFFDDCNAILVDCWPNSSLRGSKAFIRYLCRHNLTRTELYTMFKCDAEVRQFIRPLLMDSTLQWNSSTHPDFDAPATARLFCDTWAENFLPLPSPGDLDKKRKRAILKELHKFSLRLKTLRRRTTSQFDDNSVPDLIARLAEAEVDPKMAALFDPLTKSNARKGFTKTFVTPVTSRVDSVTDSFQTASSKVGSTADSLSSLADSLSDTLSGAKVSISSAASTVASAVVDLKDRAINLVKSLAPTLATWTSSLVQSMIIGAVTAALCALIGKAMHLSPIATFLLFNAVFGLLGLFSDSILSSVGTFLQRAGQLISACCAAEEAPVLDPETISEFSAPADERPRLDEFYSQVSLDDMSVDSFPQVRLPEGEMSMYETMTSFPVATFSSLVIAAFCYAGQATHGIDTVVKSICGLAHLKRGLEATADGFLWVFQHMPDMIKSFTVGKFGWYKPLRLTEEYRILLEKGEAMTTKLTTDRHRLLNDPTFCQELIDLRNELTDNFIPHLGAFKPSAIERRLACDLKKELDSCMTAAVACVNSGTRRPVPVGIYLYGESQIGKTFMIDVLGAALHGHEKKPSQEIFFANPESDFFDGYSQQHCYVIDDFYAMDPRATTKLPYGQLLTMISTGMQAVNMADLSDKGMTFKSDVVIITSNTPLNGQLYGLTHAEAFQRRFPVCCEVTLNDDFKKNNVLDVEKLRKLPPAERAKCPHLSFNLKPFGMDPTTPVHYSFSQFVRHVRAKLRAAKESHTEKVKVENEIRDAMDTHDIFEGNAPPDAQVNFQPQPAAYQPPAVPRHRHVRRQQEGGKKKKRPSEDSSHDEGFPPPSHPSSLVPLDLTSEESVPDTQPKTYSLRPSWMESRVSSLKFHEHYRRTLQFLYNKQTGALPGIDFYSAADKILLDIPREDRISGEAVAKTIYTRVLELHPALFASEPKDHVIPRDLIDSEALLNPEDDLTATFEYVMRGSSPSQYSVLTQSSLEQPSWMDFESARLSLRDRAIRILSGIPWGAIIAGVTAVVAPIILFGSLILVSSTFTSKREEWEVCADCAQQVSPGVAHQCRLSESSGLNIVRVSEGWYWCDRRQCMVWYGRGRKSRAPARGSKVRVLGGGSRHLESECKIENAILFNTPPSSPRKAHLLSDKVPVANPLVEETVTNPSSPTSTPVVQETVVRPVPKPRKPKQGVSFLDYFKKKECTGGSEKAALIHERMMYLRGSGTIISLGEGSYLAPRHFFYRGGLPIPEGTPLKVVDHNQTGYAFQLHWDSVTPIECDIDASSYTDLCIIQLPNHISPQKSALNFFSTEVDTEAAHTGQALAVTRSKGEVDLGQFTIETSTQTYNFSESAVHSAEPLKELHQFKVGTQVTYSAELTNGDCGTPIFDLTLDRPIIGIHSGRYVNLITKAAQGSAIVLPQELLRSVLARHQLKTRTRVLEAAVVLPEEPQLDQNPRAAVPTGAFHHVGYIPKQDVPYVPSKTCYTPSPLASTHIDFPNEFSPSVLTTRDPRLQEDKRNQNILLRGIQKYETPSVAYPEEFVESAVLNVYQDINRGHSTVPKRVWSIQEAVGGILGCKSAPGLEMSSSPGFPWTKTRPQGLKGKSFLFSRHADTGLYTLDENTPLYTAVQDRVRNASNFKRSWSVWQDALKDELRANEKVKIGKTRHFTMCPVDYAIHCRMYFGAFLSHMTEIHNGVPCAVGTDLYGPEYSHMIEWLLQKSDVGFSGDFSRWDGTCSNQLKLAALKLVNKWYKENDSSWTDDDDVQRLILVHESVHRYELFNGFIFRACGGMPSGTPLTAVFNSIINSLQMRVAFQALMPPSMSTMAHWDMFCRDKIYGDDNVVAVVSTALPYYNGVTVKNYLAQHGITLTPTCKSGDMVPAEPILDMEFCKVRPGKNVEPGLRVQFVPRAEESTLYKSLFWTKKDLDTVEATVSNCVDFCSKRFFYGRKVYDADCTKLKYAMEEAGLPSTLPTYDELLRVHSHKFDPTTVSRRLESSTIRVAESEDNLFVEIIDALESMEVDDGPLFEPVRVVNGVQVSNDLCQPAPLGVQNGNVPCQPISQQSHVVRIQEAEMGDEPQLSEDKGVAFAAPVGIEKEFDPAAASSMTQLMGEQISDQPWGLNELAERRTFLGTVTWTTASARNSTLIKYVAPWDFLTTRANFTPFASFVYWSGGVELIFQLNSTQYHQGKLCIFWVPMTSPSEVDVFQAKSRHSQTVLRHKMITAHDKSEHHITLPYVFYKSAMNTFDHDDQDFLGSLFINVFNPLKVGSGGTPSVMLSVWAKFLTPQFAVPAPLSTTLPQPPQSDQVYPAIKGLALKASDNVKVRQSQSETVRLSEGGSFSKTTNYNLDHVMDSSIGSGNTDKFKIKQGAGFETAASTAVDTNVALEGAMQENGSNQSGTASVSRPGKGDLDRPAVGVQPPPIVRKAYPYLCHSTQVTYQNTLGFEPNCMHMPDPCHFGTDVDEMNLGYNFQIPTSNKTYSWSATQPAGTILASGFLCPCEELLTAVKGDTVQLCNRDYFLSRFQFWSGSLRYGLDFVNTPIHGGQVGLYFHYGVFEVPATINDAVNQFVTFITLSPEMQEQWVEAPYIAPLDQLQVPSGAPKALPETAMGTWSLRVVIPLTVASVVSSEIDINLWECGGQDFRGAFLSDKNISLQPRLYEGDTEPNPSTKPYTVRLSESELDPVTGRDHHRKIHGLQENIVSAKDICKRFYPFATVTLSGSDVGLGYRFNVTQIFTKPGNSQDEQRCGMLYHFAQAFRAWRGNLSFKAFLRLSETDSQHVYVTYHPHLSTDGDLDYGAFPDATNQNVTTCLPYEWTDYNGRFMEVDVMFTTVYNFLMLPKFRNNQDLASYNTGNLGLAQVGGEVTSSTTLTLFASFADETRFGVRYGVPYMRVLGDLGPDTYSTSAPVFIPEFISIVVDQSTGRVLSTSEARTLSSVLEFSAALTPFVQIASGSTLNAEDLSVAQLQALGYNVDDRSNIVFREGVTEEVTLDSRDLYFSGPTPTRLASSGGISISGSAPILVNYFAYADAPVSTTGWTFLLDPNLSELVATTALLHYDAKKIYPNLPSRTVTVRVMRNLSTPLTVINSRNLAIQTDTGAGVNIVLVATLGSTRTFMQVDPILGEPVESSVDFPSLPSLAGSETGLPSLAAQ